MADNIETALYTVSTPIGNLKDITLRALEVLKGVDVIAAEDTRNTSVLLEKYDISTKLISYHKYSENARVELFLNYLREGRAIALVSDAGTPLISDPGEVLVNTVLKEGFRVIPIVGASAVIALLQSIPREDESFKFIAFMPRIKNQIKEIAIKNNSENLVFYESPNRLMDTLEAIYEVCQTRKIAIGRELTKKFEEIKIGTIDEIMSYYKNNPLKGEIVAMLYKDETKDEICIVDKIKKLKALNLKDKEIASIISTLFEVNKNQVYKKCLELEP